MTTNNRLHHIDSARGLAALAVVLYHISGGYADKRLMGINEQHWFAFFINGADAVSFFFVLSGFVLSYKYLKTNTLPDLKPYVIGRVFRLYPAFLFILLVHILYDYRGKNWAEWLAAWQADWFGHYREAALIYMHTPHLGQAWTLGIELVISLCIPLLILVMQHRKSYLLFFMGLSCWVQIFITPFFFHFCLGILLAHWITQTPEIAEKWFIKIKKNAYWVLPLLWIAFSLRHLLKLLKIDTIENWFASFSALSCFTLSGFSAFLILLILLHSERLKSWLSNGMLLFLGKISYSLYLCHWFILYGYFNNKHYNIMARGFSDFQATVLVSGATLVVSLLVASFMYFFIEKPFIRYGKYFLNYFSK